LNQLPARIDVLLGGRFLGGLLFFGQQEAALDVHEGRGHHEKLARDLEFQLFHASEHGQILGQHFLHRDVVNIDLVLADEKQQQIERSLKGRESDVVVV